MAARALPENAPAELALLRAWLIWRSEEAEKADAKRRKVPYYAGGGRRVGVQGTPDDRARLVTLDEARAACLQRGFDGVGIAMLGHGVTALDFDSCIDDAGHVRPDVLDLIAHTYAEISPSGRGVRAFVHGQLGNRKSHQGAEFPFGFETFETKGFVTFTGVPLPELELVGDGEIRDITPAILELCATRWPPLRVVAGPSAPGRLTQAQVSRLLAVIPADTGYDEWLKVGMALHHDTDGDGFEFWNEWSATGAKYPGLEALQRHWNSFGRGDGPAVTAGTLLRIAGHYDPSATVAGDEDFEPVDQEGEPSERLKFPITAGDAFAHGKTPGWRIRDVLPDAELAVIFGESGSGKSFLALDLAMALARGVPWRGKTTKQGRVVYIAAEGGGGFRKRVLAYAKQHGVDLKVTPFDVMHAAPNFMSTNDAVDVVKAVKATGGASLVVVDTFAQVTPGANENAGEDMSKAIANCRRIHQSTGALVVLVHHAGKDSSKGARGWSGIRAAADAEIEVARFRGSRVARVTKQKDGDDGAEFGFVLAPVALDQVDDDGIALTSCVVGDAPAPQHYTPAAPIRAGRGKWQVIVSEAFDEVSGLAGEAVTREALLQKDADSVPDDDPTKKRARDCARRALAELCELGFFYESDGRIERA